MRETLEAMTEKTASSGLWDIAIASKRRIDARVPVLPAQEPRCPEPGECIRNWSLLGQINQKQTRPQDEPVLFCDLAEEDRNLIFSRYPELNL